MAKCCRCGKEFDVSDAKAEYNFEFGDIDFDEEYGSEVCADCATADTQSNIDLGRAILMVNGDEDYDDDFVTEHL